MGKHSFLSQHSTSRSATLRRPTLSLGFLMFTISCFLSHILSLS